MLSANQLHELLGVRQNTIRQWAHRGKIQPCRLSPRFALYPIWPVLALALKAAK